jgi:hypothetical protein
MLANPRWRGSTETRGRTLTIAAEIPAGRRRAASGELVEYDQHSIYLPGFREPSPPLDIQRAARDFAIQQLETLRRQSQDVLDTLGPFAEKVKADGKREDIEAGMRALRERQRTGREERRNDAASQFIREFAPTGQVQDRLWKTTGREREESRSRVENYLKQAPIEGEPVLIGNSQALLYDLGNGVRAIWKSQEQTPDRQHTAEIGAYQVDRVLGLDVVPVTVSRVMNGQAGSLQLFVSDLQGLRNGQEITDFIREQGSTIKYFDYLLGNYANTNDRNNPMNQFHKEGRDIAIDNEKAMTLPPREPSYLDLIAAMPSREILEKVRRVPAEKLQQAARAFAPEDAELAQTYGEQMTRLRDRMAEFMDRGGPAYAKTQIERSLKGAVPGPHLEALKLAVDIVTRGDRTDPDYVSAYRIVEKVEEYRMARVEKRRKEAMDELRKKLSSCELK